MVQGLGSYWPTVDEEILRHLGRLNCCTLLSNAVFNEVVQDFLHQQYRMRIVESQSTKNDMEVSLFGGSYEM